jgi:PAS domain-containing protein
VICPPLNLVFIRVVYRCAVDYGEAKWPPAGWFGSLVPDEEAQVPGNFEATHPLEGRGCGLGRTARHRCVRGDKAAKFRQSDALGVSHHYHLLLHHASALFLQREAANVRESSALNRSLMESLLGVVCVFDSPGNIRRWNSNFLGYSAADIMRTGIIGTVAPESL